MSLPALVEPADELTIDEVRRYSRHLIIPDVGMTGQKRLKNAKVLVIGAGGLGSPALLYLAAALLPTAAPYLLPAGTRTAGAAQHCCCQMQLLPITKTMVQTSALWAAPRR